MKVGSLVELVNDNWPYRLYSHLIVYPLKNMVYTVRAININSNSEAGILLEEVDNSSLKNETFEKEEPDFYIYRFRELQPPIANIEEHINENTLEPVLI